MCGASAKAAAAAAVKRVTQRGSKALNSDFAGMGPSCCGRTRFRYLYATEQGVEWRVHPCRLGGHRDARASRGWEELSKGIIKEELCGLIGQLLDQLLFGQLGIQHQLFLLKIVEFDLSLGL